MWVHKIQGSGQVHGAIIQFMLKNTIGTDCFGPINPPCKARAFVYILIVADNLWLFL